MTESAAIEHFTDLYLRHYRQAYGYAVGRAGRDLAEEVASEVFLITWRRLTDASAAVFHSAASLRSARACRPAMVRRGHADRVHGWLDGYVRLEDFPRGTGAIGDSWAEAIGDSRRIADWTVYFRREVTERPWRQAP